MSLDRIGPPRRERAVPITHPTVRDARHIAVHDDRDHRCGRGGGDLAERAASGAAIEIFSDPSRRATSNGAAIIGELPSNHAY